MKGFARFKPLPFAALLVCLTLIAINSPKGRSASYALLSADNQGPIDTRKIEEWLDFNFDPGAPMGNAKNPAVVLPPEMALLLGDLPGAKRVGDMMFIPAAEFQRRANLPLARTLLAPVFSQLTNVKSFDDFSAIDMTGLVKGLPSELYEPGAMGKRDGEESPEAIGKLLQNGDIVFGSHIVNFMTWGKYNHVAIVTDAAQLQLIESTAHVPSDKPGVRSIDWKTFAAKYVHVGVVRLRGTSADQLARVVRWVEEKKGKPYRWPIIMGLDKTDESRVYCSQLVWLAYKRVLNIDLDSDKGVLIFPDDIYYSKEYVNVIVP